MSSELSNENVAELMLRLSRGQAWERAKGELYAMLHTFASAYAPSAAGALQFETLHAYINAFIKQVEDNGLSE